MRDIFWNWRFYKGSLLLEDESTKAARKNIKKIKKSPVAPYIEAWSKKNGFNILSTSKDLYGYLGGGAQGKVYSMAKDGREYAVKFTDPFGRRVEEERDILQKIKKIQDADPVIKKHTVNIYAIDEIVWPTTNPYDGETIEAPIFVYVVERLQPLSDVEKKYFDDTNIGKDKMLNNIFFNKGYEGWNKVRNVFKDSVNDTMIDNLLKSYQYRVDIPADQDYDLVQEKIKKEIEKISVDLVYAFDKAREGLTKADLETNKIFVDFLESPSIVHKKNLYEFYVKRMLATDSGQNYVKRIANLFDNSFSEQELAFNYINPVVAYTFDKIFKVSIPIQYTVDDDEDSRSISLQKPGPLKSLHQALMRMRNKYKITPYDLHDENVMKRGDDLVVSDLGFFR